MSEREDRSKKGGVPMADVEGQGERSKANHELNLFPLTPDSNQDVLAPNTQLVSHAFDDMVQWQLAGAPPTVDDDRQLSLPAGAGAVDVEDQQLLASQPAAVVQEVIIAGHKLNLFPLDPGLDRDNLQLAPPTVVDGSDLQLAPPQPAIVQEFIITGMPAFNIAWMLGAEVPIGEVHQFFRKGLTYKDIETLQSKGKNVKYFKQFVRDTLGPEAVFPCDVELHTMGVSETMRMYIPEGMAPSFGWGKHIKKLAFEETDIISVWYYYREPYIHIVVLKK